MSTVKLSGTFRNASRANFVQIETYRPIPNPYDTKMSYNSTFDPPLTLTNLVSGLTYLVDLTGQTPGEFDLSITGDVVAPIDKTYSNFFEDGLTFTVK